MNYPQPWLGGRWTFADVVEHHRLAAEGLLEAAADRRESLKRNFYLMNRRSVERFPAGSPFAFIVPRAQHDPGSAVRCSVSFKTAAPTSTRPARRSRRGACNIRQGRP